MNRIVTMVLRNLWAVPGAWFKLCNYAKHTDKYPELERWQHIQYILRRAITGGNVDLKVTGLENIPEENGFMMYCNHQGMFDVLAIAATCPNPLGAVLKKELYDIPFLHLDFVKHTADGKFDPVMIKNEFEEGVGHHSVIKLDGQYYAVYHGRDLRDEADESYVERRTARICKLHVADGIITAERYQDRV